VTIAVPTEGRPRAGFRRDGSRAFRDEPQGRTPARVGQSGPHPNLRTRAIAGVSAR